MQVHNNNIQIVAVSKGRSVTAIQSLYDTGQRHFAESYVQEAIQKINQLPSDSVWHFIGRLQSNKTNVIAQQFDWVQSIDRIEAAKRLDKACIQLNKKLQVCIAVNMNREPQKSGVFPEAVYELALYIKQQFPNLILRGLMILTKQDMNSDDKRSVFKCAHALFNQLNATGLELDTLSMGMSQDYEEAIAAGSTMIRLGTRLFS